jgi:hypothetical protein
LSHSDRKRSRAEAEILTLVFLHRDAMPSSFYSSASTACNPVTTIIIIIIIIITERQVRNSQGKGKQQWRWQASSAVPVALSDASHIWREAGAVNIARRGRRRERGHHGSCEQHSIFCSYPYCTSEHSTTLHAPTPSSPLNTRTCTQTHTANTGQQ